MTPTVFILVVMIGAAQVGDRMRIPVMVPVQGVPTFSDVHECLTHEAHKAIRETTACVEMPSPGQNI